MRETADKMLEQLGIKEKMDWDSTKQYGKLPVGTKVIEKGIPIFMRLDKEEEIAYIREGMKA